MPARKLKDNKTKKQWITSFYYLKNGKKERKYKRGFTTKKEAQEWEKNFLENINKKAIDMNFNELYELYINDIEHRIKTTTFISKCSIFETRILPFFNKIAIENITPLLIRKFQNKIVTEINIRTNTKYTGHYVKKVLGQLVAILNYAVNFHELKENPCAKAGNLKIELNKKINYWELEEFYKFIEVIKHKPMSYAGFNILFWTGMRVGEMLALTLEDIDLIKNRINIDKTYTRVRGKDMITTPKTSSSIRNIAIGKKLKIILENYIKTIYKLEKNERIISVTHDVFRNDIARHYIKAGVTKIRVHDLRHSHASMLINAKVNPLAISKRLGHAKVDMTLNIYSHLYRKTENEMVKILDEF